jgi:hypothetical protein
MINRVGQRLLQAFEGASAAYSLRDLASNIASVVRVRRASDNTEKDFSAVDVSSGAMTEWVNKDSATSSAAADVIYDSFNYPSGGYLKHQSTGGQNWKDSGGWDGTSGESWRISGTGKSLFYGQGSGLGLVIDNTKHIWCESQVDNYRDFFSPIAASSTYCTMLVRAYDSRPYDPDNTGTAADVLKFRIEFYDGTDATGNMRMNVGINQGTLFANTNSTGYAPSGSATSAGAFEDDKTYLLAMKRTGSDVFASLIEADGNPATLDSEPTWQINDAGLTGVNFQSMRLFGDNTDPSNFRGIRVDELRIADSWEDAVEGITTPTSTVDGFVETWYDQSGNGNDATQETAGNQPKIVNAGVLVSGGLSIGSGQHLSTTLSGTSFALNNASSFVLGQASGGQGIGALTTVTSVSWFSNPYRYSNTQGFRYGGESASSQPMPSSVQLFTLIGGSTIAEGFANGTSYRSLASVSTTFTNPSFRIGSYTNNLITGSVKEVIIYTADQSANRAAIEANINNQYDIY